MSGDRSRWEARYAGQADRAVRAPSAWLVRHLPSQGEGVALDLACGDGRNALYLARHGFTVDAVDIAFAGLARLSAAARVEGLAVRCIQADLEHFPLPVDRYAVLVNIRYLQRSLFPAMRRAIAPGGIVVFETFLRAQARLGHPRNPAFLLDPGELRAAFADFEVLAEEEGLLEADGEPAHLARLVARRAGRVD
jgi:tellurite methyltransferase